MDKCYRTTLLFNIIRVINKRPNDFNEDIQNILSKYNDEELQVLSLELENSGGNIKTKKTIKKY